MDRLKGLGSSLVGAAGNMVDKSGWGDKLSYLKESYLNKVYDVRGRKFIVKKLIAEGGFGYVFLVREQPAYGAPPNAPERLYALKRILVQDRERIDAIKTEVNLMKALTREPHVVRLEDHQLNDSRHELEVLLLMEICTCSLLDAMNQGRVRSEQDIYEIFSQICEAVSRLHAMNPPISHRDLKVENVLLGEDGKWKLCDFGSATTATYLANTERERSVAEEDINRNTTMMYRAPEMVDLYRRQPINEKVDIWALGCVLFKMAYMTDAFDSGLGILNARYTFPEFRKTSTNFEEFIAYMLTPDPTARPNIQQVQERLATLRGVPFKQRPANPAQTSPTSRSTNTNTPSRDTNTKRQPAPAQNQAAVADLLVWSDGPTLTTPTKAPAHQPAQPQPIAQQSFHNAASQPTKQASASLFDTLDWHASNTSASKPSPASPASRQVAPKPTPASSTTQRPHTASPIHPHIPKNTAPSSQDGPDLLDFSAPISKPAPQQPHFTSPPIASPTGFYSPQPHRPNYSLGPPAYYQPYQQGPGQHNRPVQGQDLLAQFALPKQQSTVVFDDFDPYAKPTQPSASTPPQVPHKPAQTNSQLPAPPAAAQSRNKGQQGGDSLIFF